MHENTTRVHTTVNDWAYPSARITMSYTVTEWAALENTVNLKSWSGMYVNALP